MTTPNSPADSSRSGPPESDATPFAPAPVQPAHFTVRTRIALWGLRVFTLVVSAMVIYTFISQL